MWANGDITGSDRKRQDTAIASHHLQNIPFVPSWLIPRKMEIRNTQRAMDKLTAVPKQKHMLLSALSRPILKNFVKAENGKYRF
jgi:hypothetical protein